MVVGDGHVQSLLTFTPETLKTNADITNHAKPRALVIGDNVLLKQKKCNKLTTPFDPKPYTVVAVKGMMVTARRKKHEITGIRLTLS